MGISRDGEIERSVMTAASGAPRLKQAINTPVITVICALGLNGSSASAARLPSSPGWNDGSEAMESNAAEQHPQLVFENFPHSVTDCAITPQGGLDDRDALQDQTVLPLLHLQDVPESL